MLSLFVIETAIVVRGMNKIRLLRGGNMLKWGFKKKYRYNVSLSAEGRRSGTVDLTKEEAEIVAYATNPKNWKNAFYGEYYGEFKIDIEHPMEIKD